MSSYEADLSRLYRENDVLKQQLHAIVVEVEQINDAVSMLNNNSYPTDKMTHSRAKISNVLNQVARNLGKIERDLRQTKAGAIHFKQQGNSNDSNDQ